MGEEELDHASRSYKTLPKIGLIILPSCANFYLGDEWGIKPQDGVREWLKLQEGNKYLILSQLMLKKKK